MSISALCIRRPVTTVMVILIAGILGVISLISLKQDLMPEMNLGIAVVFASYDGAGPQEIENMVTKPLESALGTVNNLKNISSVSSGGMSLVILEFSEGTDMDNAALKMRENTDLVKRFLPDGVEPRVLQIDPNMMQLFTLGVTGDYDLVKLKTILDDEIIGRLEKLEGVGSVSDSGGREREIGIELHPDKLAGYGISANQIAGVLAAENINRPAGTMTRGDTEIQIRTTGEFKSVSEIENMPLTTPRGATIRLGDVADVIDGFKKTTSFSLINGREGIILSVQKQSIANTVDVADRINKEVENLRRDYPDLEFSVLMDTSSFIKNSLSNVWTTVIMATALAVIVLLLFLGSIRSSIIIGVAIPISIIVTMALMYFSDLTMNMITLNALVISVGMLVDNSIVVLESISRHLNTGKDPKAAAYEGTREVGISVVASTLTTVVVFVPVIFVEGIAGKMFGQLGLIIAFSLISSLAVSLTFVPMACSRFLKPGDTDKRKTFLNKPWERWNTAYKNFEIVYARLLRAALTHRKTVIFAVIAFIAATGSVIGFIGMDYMPSMDQGFLGINVSTPRGSRLEEISAAADTVIERIAGIEEIREVSVSVGGGGMMSLFGGGSSSASFTIQLIPKAQRPAIDIVAENIREAIGDIAGAEVTVSSSGGFDMGGNTVSLTVYGDDFDTLANTAEDLAALIATLPNIRNAESSLREGTPQARVVTDRNKASTFGLQASYVASAVNTAINGTTVTKYKISGDETDVTLRYPPERVKYISDLNNLAIITPAGISIPLSEVADVYEEQGPASIAKENHKQYMTVSADFINVDLNTITNEIGELLDGYNMPNGISYKFGGIFETMMESFRALLLALLLGFVLVYMVIASQFESLIYPATILISIPVAWTCGLLGVFLLGNSLSIAAMIGMILLMGIVVNNGIVLVDYININRKEGKEAFDAILAAGPVRLRPILMTTITTVIGLLPMLLSFGEGSEMQKPLGAVIAFGLLLSTLVTLVLIPVLYMSLHNFMKKRRINDIKI
ncbi:MAG: efflux RND transporter permease subunit [Oscillospiraceae bacterium]|nr:efflux RND transporter permease subunit [Oscillospiraceae bacterium]